MENSCDQKTALIVASINANYYPIISKTDQKPKILKPSKKVIFCLFSTHNDLFKEFATPYS